jgi:hypothetical protein
MGLLSRLFSSKKDQSDAQPEHNIVSLVTLLRESVTLELESMRFVLDSVFPGAFVPQNDDSFVIQGSIPLQLMVKSIVPSHSGIFFVNYVPGLYTEFSSFAAHITDPFLKSWVGEHRAWLSIDQIAEIGSEEPQDLTAMQETACQPGFTSLRPAHANPDRERSAAGV